MKRSLLKYISIIAGVIILDQVSKGLLLYLITGHVPVFGNAWEIVSFPYLMMQVTDFFNIVFTWNPGASFSLFRALGNAAPVAIIAITGAIIAFIAFYTSRRAASYERAPLCLILGGAIGNLIDRVRFGAVIDFLDFHVNAYHWPAFNVADVCICIGVGLFILNWWRARQKCLNNIGK